VVKTDLDFTETRDSEWQWHQLGHMQACISLQTDNHASTPPLKFLTGRMPFLPPNQQRQSTEGTHHEHTDVYAYVVKRQNFVSVHHEHTEQKQNSVSLQHNHKQVKYFCHYYLHHC